MQSDTAGTVVSGIDQRSKARRITSRVVIALVALWFLVLNVFALSEIVFMWLPEETVGEIFGEGDMPIPIHRSHFMAIGVMSWAVVLSVVVQVRKPERRLAPLLLVIGAVIAGTILFGLNGTLGEWLLEEIAFVAAPVGLLVLVHPARDRLFTRPHFDRAMTGMAVLASVPWLVYILDNAWNQWQSAAGDPHAEPEHWGVAALMGVIIALAAILGASDKPGWRLTAWISVGGSLVFGVHSLVFPGLASALPMVWAVAAILWGVGYAAMIVRRSHVGDTVPVTG